MVRTIAPLLLIFAAAIFKGCSGHGDLIKPMGCDEGDGTYADPTFCEMFYQCRQGAIYTFSCPRTTVFNHLIKLCDSSDNYICEFKCPLEDGVYADPKHCGGFFFCRDRVKVPMSCPEEFPVFNPEVRVCDTTENYPCGKSNVTATTATTAATTTTAVTTTSTPTTTAAPVPGYRGPEPTDPCDFAGPPSKMSNCKWTITTTETSRADLTLENVLVECTVAGTHCVEVTGSSTLTIISSTLRGNQAGRFVAVKANCHLAMSYVLVTRFGTLSLYGGVIEANYGSGTSVTLDHVDMNNNKAKNGGCVVIQGSLSVNSSIFTENTAAEKGGAFFVGDCQGCGFTQSFIDCTFERNTAKEGGAVYNREDTAISSSTFISNTGSVKGGAIYGDGKTTINGASVFQNNVSPDGSIYYCEAMTKLIIGTHTTIPSGAIGGTMCVLTKL